MSARDYLDVVLFIFTVLLAIIGFFMSAKLAKNDSDIKELQAAHVRDVADLTDLKLKVAEAYPSKVDIKEMFESFKNYLDERFNAVEQIARYSGNSNNNTGDRSNNRGN